MELFLLPDLMCSHIRAGRANNDDDAVAATAAGAAADEHQDNYKLKRERVSLGNLLKFGIPYIVFNMPENISIIRRSIKRKYEHSSPPPPRLFNATEN